MIKPPRLLYVQHLEAELKEVRKQNDELVKELKRRVVFLQDMERRVEIITDKVREMSDKRKT